MVQLPSPLCGTIMYDHPGASFFVLVQSSTVSPQMPYCTHLSLDHLQGEQLLLAHLGLIMVVEVGDTTVQPWMPSS